MAGKYIDEFPMAWLRQCETLSPCDHDLTHICVPVWLHGQIADGAAKHVHLQLVLINTLAHCQHTAVQVKASMRTLMGGAHASITAACAEYHKRFRRNVYVTPKSYLSFLDGYRKLYSEKLAETRELASSINVGLQKMNDAKVDVKRMKVGARLCLWHGPCISACAALHLRDITAS